MRLPSEPGPAGGLRLRAPDRPAAVMLLAPLLGGAIWALAIWAGALLLVP